MSSVSESYKIFLDQFVNEHLSKPPDEKIPPFRLVETQIRPFEVSGHCCEWATQYLYTHRCPVYLLNQICVETVKRVTLTEPYSHIPSPDLDETKVLNDSETWLEARALCDLTFKTVEDIITEWLSEPPTNWVESSEHGGHVVSHYAIKNTRRKMEDRHTMIPLMRMFTTAEAYQDASLYAVYDGHGGPEASYYCAAQFLNNLIGQTLSPTDKAKSLEAAFSKTDADFGAKAAKENLRSGSTGVVLLIESNILHIAWLGDSQAILVSEGRVVEIMKPHKPESEEEKQRIEALGGSVVWHGTWRVNGTLAVSRAIGDIDHKPYISSKADSKTHPLDQDDEYVIVACDGLWDTVTPQEATQLVYEHVQSGKPFQSVAEVLVRAAKNEGSTDNITVIVVFLKQTLSPPTTSEDNESNDEYEDALEEIV